MRLHATLFRPAALAPLPAVLLAALLAACAPLPTEPSQAAPAAIPAAAPHALPEAYYGKLRAAGQPVLRIDAQRSLIAVTVRRGGALARFGHDHVVASRAIEGYAAPRAGHADFRFRLDQMTVDDAALRSQAGLETQPPADAVAGTRHNMLTRALDAERHPYVLVRVERAAGAATLKTAITLHGVTRQYTLPATLSVAPRSVTASGTLTLLQSDFGVVPFSVMGGALAVQDKLELRFEIVAVP